MGFQSKIDLKSVLSQLDVFVIASSIFFTLFIGWYAGSKRSGSSDTIADYLVMGRRITLPLFVLSLVSSWYGGIFGVTAIAFESGVFNFVTQGLFWYGSYLFFALVMIHRIHPYQVLTVPELVERMYGKNAALVAAVFNFFNMLPIAYSLSLGLFIQFFTGIDLPTSIILGTGFVILYSAFGGMRADVYTDVFQTILMYTSMFAVVAFSLSTFGGITFLQENLPQTHFDPLGTHTLAQTLLWGFIALGTLVDPTFYQRCFSTSDPKKAKKGVIIAIGFWMVFDLMTTSVGMYARAALPQGVASQDSFLIYSMQLLPNGFRGLLIAGVLATIMSTVDSFNFVAATTINYDLIGHKKDFKRLNYAAAVALTGLLSAYMAYHFNGSIKSVWKTMGSYWSGCLVVPIVVGLCTRYRMNSKTFVISTTLSALAITYWRNAPLTGVFAEVDDLYVGLFVSSITMIFYYFKARKAGA